MGPFIQLRSASFPVLPGEEEELVNEGMYGKALARYLVEKLGQRGYTTAGYCCEDWGWWVGLDGYPFTFGVCIYGRQRDDGALDLWVTDGAEPRRQWNWKAFRFVESGAAEAAATLHADLVALFAADPAIDVVATDLDAPFGD